MLLACAILATASLVIHFLVSFARMVKADATAGLWVTWLFVSGCLSGCPVAAVWILYAHTGA